MTNDCFKNRGGWFLDTIRGTGVAFGVVVVSLLSHPAEAKIGTAGSSHVQPSQNRQPCFLFSPQLKVAANYHADIQRTTAEDLAQIRAIFKPAVSELSNIFGVSRQAVYNWLGGEEPVSQHTSKIRDLASAADVMVAEGVSITSHVLKRKITDGKSLFEIVQDGGSAKEGAQLLARILRSEKEQRRALDLRLANRVKPEVNSMDIGSLVFDEQV